MGGVRQVSLDPLRTKRVFECLYYHGKDLCVGCREMLCSTLSHRSEVTETCPGRENQQILLTLFEQAQAHGLIGKSDSERLTFLGLAEHAKMVGSANPCGLFAALVHRQCWHF